MDELDLGLSRWVEPGERAALEGCGLSPEGQVLLGFSTSVIAFKKPVTFKAQALRKLSSMPISHLVKSLKRKIKAGLTSKKKKELRAVPGIWNAREIQLGGEGGCRRGTATK